MFGVGLCTLRPLSRTSMPWSGSLPRWRAGSAVTALPPLTPLLSPLPFCHALRPLSSPLRPPKTLLPTRGTPWSAPVVVRVVTRQSVVGSGTGISRMPRPPRLKWLNLPPRLPPAALPCPWISCRPTLPVSVPSGPPCRPRPLPPSALLVRSDQ